MHNVVTLIYCIPCCLPNVIFNPQHALRFLSVICEQTRLVQHRAGHVMIGACADPRPGGPMAPGGSMAPGGTCAAQGRTGRSTVRPAGLLLLLYFGAGPKRRRAHFSFRKLNERLDLVLNRFSFFFLGYGTLRHLSYKWVILYLGSKNFWPKFSSAEFWNLRPTSQNSFSCSRFELATTLA